MQRLYVTFGIAFLASFVSKLAADAWLQGKSLLLSDFVGLHYTQNPGIAFGIRLPEQWQTGVIVLAMMLVGIAAWRSARTRSEHLGFGLILGGALGNVVDRLPDGLVTDFFRVGSFPVFNVADSCITIGVTVLLLEGLLTGRRIMSKHAGKEVPPFC